MASKSQTIEVNTCDFCGKSEGCYDKCLGCGKDVCWDCKNTIGMVYNHAVYFSGSGDGFYCSACDAKLTARKHPRLMAYKGIQSLRRELEGFHADFKTRMEAAEKHLKTFSSK